MIFFGATSETIVVLQMSVSRTREASFWGGNRVSGSPGFRGLDLRGQIVDGAGALPTGFPPESCVLDDTVRFFRK